MITLKLELIYSFSMSLINKENKNGDKASPYINRYAYHKNMKIDYEI